MLDAIREAHLESWAFVITCPLIIAIPVLAEFAQHIVEMRVGMYTGPDGAEAAQSNPMRLYFGFAKTLALTIIGYSVIRFLHGGHDGDAARTLEPRAAGLFALVMGLQALLTYLSLFVFTGDNSIAAGFFIFGLIFAPLVARFFAAAPLGVLITPQTSIRAMAPHFLWAFAFSLLAILPLMAVHYGLGIGAVFAPQWLKWPLLVVDSLVVGWLAALLAAVTYLMALRAGPLGTLSDDGR